MNLKLIANMPCKRFDSHPKLCADGRGGWVFSQVNVDRSISGYQNYWLLFFLGVLVMDAKSEDYVEATRLTARMEDEIIGTNEMEWHHPNPMWGYQNGDAIFEWPQSIALAPEQDGLIIVNIDVKLNSERSWMRVEGHAYCRIAKVPRMANRFVHPLTYTFRNLFQKPFQPGGKDFTKPSEHTPQP